MASSLRLHQHEKIIRIELTAEDGLPRLETSLLDSLDRELTSLFVSSTCNGIVIHGSEKCFATGADLAQVSRLHGVEAFDFARRGQLLYQKIHHSPKPVVAAISGYCMGGAWDLALACHYRIATSDAVFRHPGPTVGILTGWGGTQRIPRAIGPARANALLLEGRKISAAEALSSGLLNELAEPGELQANAIARAQSLAGNP